LAELVGRLPEPPTQVFVCGSNPFVEAAADATLATGVDPGRVRTERFGG
jgi:ferredoxin-NADP reductase